MARNRRRTGRGVGRPLSTAAEEPIRLTVVLAGRQEAAVAAFRGDGDAAGSVNVRLGRARLVFTDPAAAEFVAARWAGMTGLAGKLPAEFERSTPAAPVQTSGEAIPFRVPPTVGAVGRVVRPRGHTCWLQVQIGPVQFSVRDTTAFHTAAAGLRRAAQVAAMTLPAPGPASPRQTAVRSVASALAAPLPDSGRSPGIARSSTSRPVARPEPGSTPGSVVGAGGGL
jgi:hypothetical protein